MWSGEKSLLQYVTPDLSYDYIVGGREKRRAKTINAMAERRKKRFLFLLKPTGSPLK